VKTVCLDPGHGGSDPGACGPTLRESDQTLDVCLRAREILRPYCNVIMTRTDDEYVGLTARAEFSNRNDSDVFISYHFNSADKDSANGFEIFTTPPENNSDKLAAKIWSAHRKQLPAQWDRGLKEANFTVIAKAACPAVLIEGEFIHTPAGEAFIIQNKQAMAHAVADGVLAYLGLDTASVLTLEQRVARIEEHLLI
jgi:N-acetylmuramoyl-L-alanine amidase